MQLSDSTPLCAEAVAHPNIALIKYWGKAGDLHTNEPAVASLSITLDTLQTRTRLTFDAALESDTLILNGQRDERRLPRISEALDRLRALGNTSLRCEVETENNFPTGAGLASSASGFAALVVAGNTALGLELSLREQSMLARAMSGSAARSLFGGFARIALTEALNPPDPTFGSAYAQPILEASHWPLEVCVAVVSDREKPVGSTEGMELSRHTSPYYAPWLEGNNRDIEDAERHVRARDFEALAELSEFSCLKMHAMAMASRPGLLYWHGTTVTAMHEIRAMRAEGIPVFFTIDAGPQVKAICAPGYGDQVAARLEGLPGVQSILRCGLGEGARIV